MLNTLELSPAYGRTYTTQRGFKEDWNKGLDFYSTLAYTSNRDIQSLLEAFQTVYFTVVTHHGGETTVYVIRHGKVQGWVKDIKE